MDIHIPAVIVAAVIAGVVPALGHLTSVRRAGTIVRYVYGVACILAACATYALLTGAWLVFVLPSLFATVSGAVVVAMHKHDHDQGQGYELLDLQRANAALAERVADLRRQLSELTDERP